MLSPATIVADALLSDLKAIDFGQPVTVIKEDDPQGRREELLSREGSTAYDNPVIWVTERGESDAYSGRGCWLVQVEVDVTFLSPFDDLSSTLNKRSLLGLMYQIRTEINTKQQDRFSWQAADPAAYYDPDALKTGLFFSSWTIQYLGDGES